MRQEDFCCWEKGAQIFFFLQTMRIPLLGLPLITPTGEGGGLPELLCIFIFSDRFLFKKS
jgi:hypothetical protein